MLEQGVVQPSSSLVVAHCDGEEGRFLAFLCGLLET